MKYRFLRASTLEDLKSSIEDNLSIYRTGQFVNLAKDGSRYFEGATEFDEKLLTELKVPEGEKLFEEQNCAILYKALKNLSPYEARDERLWAYFAHTVLLDHSRQRWPIPEDNENAVNHIKKHFFASNKRAIERDNAISRLWWMARLCDKVPGIELSEALKVFLHRSDVRANIVERPTVAQSNALFGALLKALYASLNGEGSLFERKKFRSLMIRINSIGGVKLLDCMASAQLEVLVLDIVKKDLGLVLE